MNNSLKDFFDEEIFQGFLAPGLAEPTLPLPTTLAGQPHPSISAPATPPNSFIMDSAPVPLIPGPLIDTPIPPIPDQIILDDEELERFVQKQKNENTKRKTKYDVKKWYEWSKSVGETRPIEDIPPVELNRLLGHYYCKVRKNNGPPYEPDTITSFQSSLDRHLTKTTTKAIA